MPKQMGFENVPLWGWNCRRDHSRWHHKKAIEQMLWWTRHGLCSINWYLLQAMPLKRWSMSLVTADLRDLVDLTSVYDVVYIQSVDMFPYSSDRSCGEVSQESFNRTEPMIFLGNHVWKGQGPIVPMKYLICLCATRVAAIGGRGWANLYRLLYGRDPGVSPFMCRTSGLSSTCINNQIPRSSALFSVSASLWSSVLMPWSLSNFSLSLDVENRHLEFMVDYESRKTIYWGELMPYGEKNGPIRGWGAL